MAEIKEKGNIFNWLIVLWLVHAAQIVSVNLFDISFSSFGIRPREFSGLIGIATAHFVHGSWHHLASNTFSALIVGLILFKWSYSLAVEATLCVALGSGLFCWAFGESGTSHVGFSGILFGWLGFIIGNGFFRRTWLSIILAAVVGGLHTFAILSLFSAKEGISWTMHAGGFITGLLTAYLYRKEKR
jgi:membrane associated rhomboid family serine protease